MSQNRRCFINVDLPVTGLHPSSPSTVKICFSKYQYPSAICFTNFTMEPRFPKSLLSCKFQDKKRILRAAQSRSLDETLFTPGCNKTDIKTERVVTMSNICSVSARVPFPYLHLISVIVAMFGDGYVALPAAVFPGHREPSLPNEESRKKSIRVVPRQWRAYWRKEKASLDFFDVDERNCTSPSSPWPGERGHWALLWCLTYTLDTHSHRVFQVKPTYQLMLSQVILANDYRLFTWQCLIRWNALQIY